jgi:hypothetical protein
VHEPTQFLSTVSAALTATAATLLTGLQEFGAASMTEMRKHTPHAIQNSMLHISPLFIGTLKKVGLPK